MKYERRFDNITPYFSFHELFARMIFAAALGHFLFLLPLLALTAVAPAQADEISPYIGHRFGGNFTDNTTSTDFKVGDSNSFGLVLDFDLEPDKQIEVLLSRQNTYLSTGEPLFTPNPLFDLSVDYYHIGGIYILPQGNRIRPFLTGTFGLTRMSPKRAGYSTENRFSISLGTGAKIFFSKNLGARVDVRGIYTALDSSTEVFCSGGCTIKLSSSGFVQTDISAAIILRF